MDRAQEKRGPWTVLQSTKVYQDPWLSVRKDDVIRPDGDPGTHSVVTIKPGVSVLAIDTEHNVFLTSEFHYAVNRVTLEAVSGGIESSEEAVVSAKRELREELGIIAKDWTDLGTCDPFTASLLSPTKLYLAQDLSFVDAAPEGTEVIQSIKMPLAEAIEKVMQSEVTHAPSCTLILKAARYLGV
ncbi:NUDIX domain-containing protein [Planctomycetes bacterium K23_9]|uniref:GDP-mannose pyrophosphatase n=1 Tax=Stieleria marina TaxID=1930275 RepID=A0A517P036_9BACT|nr:ADP-ribose pyrophosphatase [Planctomycetes bacterium K23_9]